MSWDLPADAALVLPWIEALSRLFGPLPAGSASPDGDPDGYDGLDRRGPLERLLMSEWALLQENPDEFIRRFAMREVAYLHPRRSAPRSERWSVAVFDAGPVMLGVPRLVQASLMLALADRADRAGATYAVGVLQQAPALLPFEPERDRLRLMAARTSRAASHDDVRRWRAAIPPRGELVLVGPGGVSVTEDGDGLVVAFEHRRVRLPRPPDAASVSAMRALETPAPKPRIAPPPVPAREPAAGTHASTPGTLFFSSDGRRLIVRESGPEVDAFVAHHVPDNTKTTPGRPVRLQGPIGARPAAVGWRGKRFVAVWDRAGVIEGHEISAPDIPFRGVAPGAPVPQLVWNGRHAGWMVLLDRGVWTFQSHGRSSRADTQVLAATSDGVRVREKDGFLWRSRPRGYAWGPVEETRLGPLAPFALRDDVVFWSVEEQKWRAGPAVIGTDPRWQLLGAGPGPSSGWFALDTRIFLAEAAGQRAEWSARGPIVEAAVSDLGERLAVRTAENEILVYSERFGEIVLRLAPGT